jgi:hypothetical protein
MKDLLSSAATRMPQQPLRAKQLKAAGSCQPGNLDR